MPSIPLADLQQRSRCNTQLQNHGFCTVDDGESDHEHAVQDVFDARTKPFRLENRSSSSQGSYGRGSQSSPSNEDVSTEYSRGSTDRDDMGALATRGVSPHRSTAEECPPPRTAKMETDKLLRQPVGTVHLHDTRAPSMAYIHSSAQYSGVLLSDPVPPINDVMLGQMEFELAFTGVEMGVHIAGTVVVSALIALSVWLTVANITL